MRSSLRTRELDLSLGRPLAVGEALLSGPEMVAQDKGKAVRSIHHVGDELWRVDEQP